MDRLNVAIVDDENGIRESYKRLLKREYKNRYEDGTIEILAFEDGASCLKALIEDEIKVDAVILDYHLKDMLGDEVLLRLREKDKNIPVVMVTSHDSSETTRATFKAGGIELTEYIPKPPDFKLLLYTIELLCEKRQKMAFRDQLMEIERSYKLLKEISENWKQPMNIVSIILYRMSEEDNAKERGLLFDEAYKHIKKASTLLDIFKDYTLFSKQRNMFDLCVLVEETLPSYSPRFKESGIEVTFKSELQSFKIYGYEKLISKSLFYIFRNCADALEQSEIKHKKVDIKIEDLGIGCNLIISDNAGVLKKEFLDTILDPRYESDGKNRGGMELYLSYLCITANGGAIKCLNKSDGVAFVIYFS